MSPARRLVSLTALAILAVGLGVVEYLVERPSTQAAATDLAPAGASADAGSSAWYCVGATTDETGLALGTVVIANASERDLTATVTAVATEAAPVATVLAVPALSRTDFALQNLLTASHVAAVVELDGGSAAVELATAGPLGETSVPCASTAATEWYLADGVTSRDALEVLLAFNPFPDDALVDMTFVTGEGTISPEALTGITVRGGALVAFDLGEFVPRQEAVSAVVSTRSGRLVVARRQSFDGSVDRRGVALALGATSPATEWTFAEGLAAEGLVERFQIFNPGDAEARLEIDLFLDEGQAEPILVSVPAESQLSVVANNEPRIPPGVGHSVRIRSVNEVAVVVERRVEGSAPSARTGLSLTGGARSPAERWLVSEAKVDPGHDQFVVIHNPGPQAVRASIELLIGRRASVPGLEAVEVAPGSRAAIRLGDHGVSGPLSLLLSADGPVVVEKAQFRVGEPGMAMSMAVPLR